MSTRLFFYVPGDPDPDLRLLGMVGFKEDGIEEAAFPVAASLDHQLVGPFVARSIFLKSACDVFSVLELYSQYFKRIICVGRNQHYAG